jgi:ABC-type transporter Mla MlaB component
MVSFTKKNHTLKCSGNLSIEECAEIKTIFEKALATNSNLNIEFDAVEKIDAPFMQLVHALHNSAKIQHKKVTLSQPLPNNMAEIIHNTGMQHFAVWQTADKAVLVM